MLGLLPLSLPWRIVGGLGLAVALYGAHAWDRHRAASAAHAAGAAEVRAEWQAETIKAQRAAIEAEQVQRAEEQRRAAAQQEVIDHAEMSLVAARADAARARTAADRLRARVAELAAAADRPAGEDPAAAGSGQATGGSGLLLADLFGRIDGRAGELAEYADQARAAGQACERAYDALTGK